MRVYLVENHKYPSVTTILDIINKPGLMYYYGKHGTQKAMTLANKSRIIGNRLHKYIEKDCAGNAKPYYELLKSKGKLSPEKKHGQKLQDMINQYLIFKTVYQFEPHSAEQTVYSRLHKYAGTIDSIGTVVYKGLKLLVILDWKSSGKVYDEYLLQVVAYLYAYKEMHPEALIDGVCCVSFNKELMNREPDIKLVSDQAVITEMFDVFLSALKIYNWKERRGK